MYSPFTYDEEQFIFQLIRKLNTPKLKAAAPSRYLYLLHGKHHIPELLYLLFRIAVGRIPSEAVQILIIVIFYLLALRQPADCLSHTFHAVRNTHCPLLQFREPCQAHLFLFSSECYPVSTNTRQLIRISPPQSI